MESVHLGKYCEFCLSIFLMNEQITRERMWSSFCLRRCLLTTLKIKTHIENRRCGGLTCTQNGWRIFSTLRSYQLSLRGWGETEPVCLSTIHEGGVELRGVHAQERGQGDGNVKKLDKWEVPGQSLGHPPFSAVEVVMVLQRDRHTLNETNSLVKSTLYSIMCEFRRYPVIASFNHNLPTLSST